MRPVDHSVEPLAFNLHRFLGDWTFDRVASDGTVVSGTMVFEDAGDCIRYLETGTMTLDAGAQFSTSRQYFFSQSGANVRIFFDRSRVSIFHDLDIKPEINGFVGRGEHLCRQDTYQSTYRFEDNVRFQTIHEVRGPKKNYTLDTNYFRIGV